MVRPSDLVGEPGFWRGITIALAVGLVGLITPGVQAQYTDDFENATYTASAAGDVITGQNGFYIPVPDSQDGLVYTYAGNTLLIPDHPTGGGDQFVGVTGGDPALPVPFARAQKDTLFGAGVGSWKVTFDVAVTYLGTLPAAQNIGSFSTALFPDAATFIALSEWTDPVTAATWDASYVWYDAAGTQLIEDVGDPAFQELEVDKWYQRSTTFDLATNQIVEVSITDLSAGTTVTVEPVDRYLVGGMAGGLAPPTGFRFFAGSATAAGNTVAFDNVEIEEVVAPSGDSYIRGDCDGDGSFNGLLDGIAALNFQFLPGTDPPPCLRACDADGDRAFNGLVDGIRILNVQFTPGTPPPPFPYPDCGVDPNVTVPCETPPQACW